jgi:DNA-directed RNA polymerase subunit RPC12/RpoP
MFCPKCGKDSGEFMFCPYCGTKIPDEEVKTAVWSMGMACPHCGGTRLEGNNCAFCGAQLMVEIPEKEANKSEYASIPLGAYKGCNSFLQLDEKGVLIRNEKHDEHRIPYGEITAVGLRKHKLFSFAWLSFRWTENAYLPLPTKFLQACNDETTFFYFSDDEVVVQQIFYAIKEVVEKNNGVACIL